MYRAIKFQVNKFQVNNLTNCEICLTKRRILFLYTIKTGQSTRPRFSPLDLFSKYVRIDSPVKIMPRLKF